MNPRQARILELRRKEWRWQDRNLGRVQYPQRKTKSYQHRFIEEVAGVLGFLLALSVMLWV